jgi:hypothetical protein
VKALGVRSRPALRVLALAAAAGTVPPSLAGRAAATESASLSVEVYRGLGAEDASSPGPSPERVELVVDLTRSMLRASADGRPLADLARGGAAALLRSLDESAEAALTVLGHAAGEGCTASERLAAAAPAPARRDAADRLGELAPRSESSLAGALDQVRRQLEGEGGGRRARVVAVTDLEDGAGDPCGGDLCEAARRLVAAGAWLEIVPTREVDPPACLSGLLPSPAPPPSAAGTDAEPTFSVALDAAADEVVAEGRAGEGAVPVPPGLVTLLVHLDPPERIGPFRLAPGDAARVSVLESRESGVPRRVWRVERGDEAVGRAFPPPDELPQER